jgi:hypothetical protein
MPFNIISVLVASLITLLIGFVWFNPKVFGTIWMTELGITKDQAKPKNLSKIIGLTVVFSLMIAFTVPGFVIHQLGALQMAGSNLQDEAFLAYMKVHGNAFRTVKHGALHGLLCGLFFVFPILAINAMLEHRSWKYLFVTAGYWIVTLLVMGAIICGWP